MKKQMGVPASPSGHSRAEPEEVSVVPTSVPNAWGLAQQLRAYRGGTTEWRDLMDDAANLLEQFATTVRHIYATKLPDTWFVCGASTNCDTNGLPSRVHICPAYGCDWFAIYERVEGERG